MFRKNTGSLSSGDAGILGGNDSAGSTADNIVTVFQLPLLVTSDTQLWMDDSASDECLCCGKSFRMFNRRHHWYVIDTSGRG